MPNMLAMDLPDVARFRKIHDPHGSPAASNPPLFNRKTLITVVISPSLGHNS